MTVATKFTNTTVIIANRHRRHTNFTQTSSSYGIKKSIISSITTPIIKFLGKIHILKHPIEILEKLDKSIDNFSEQFKFMKSEKKMVLEMFITAVVQSFAYYSITYMVYRAFGNYGISFWQIIPTQAFLLLIMTFIPTPGSGLGAE